MAIQAVLAGAPKAIRPFALATVQSLATGSPPTCQVLIDGAATNASANVESGYSPRVGDRVITTRHGSQIYIVVPLTSAAALAADSGWIAPTFGNHYANFAGFPVGYRKINGIVYLKGLLSADATGVTGGTTAFTLPAGYRPTQQMLFGPLAAAFAANYVIVLGTGAVQSGSNMTSTGYISLDGISFVADA